MKIFILLLMGILFSAKVLAQSGCTDPQASNYNPAATINDGSCTYTPTTYTLTNPKILPASLNENSGLIYTDGQLWTLNDSGSAAAIYRISETDGSILQTVNVANATNTDWEAITADANYIYIGDFGNNTNGSRTNLKIYRLRKAAIGTGTVITATPDIINFSYQDQVNPVPTTTNNTKFDCEAFLVKNNVVHLFTKDWLTYSTVHYTLPATPGTHLAQRKEELAANGLITDAHISGTHADEIALIGYSADLTHLFMWLLYDYAGENFFSGNKRRIELGSALQGQIEGVTFTSNGTGYISSESINRTVFGFPVVASPKLFSFSTEQWVPLPVEISRFTANYSAPVVKLAWQTVAEKENDFFILERSADAVHFKEIGRKKGAGNSSISVSYSFTDQEPLSGTSYYRLKQTDFNGNFSYSPIRSVTAAPPKFNLIIFPVPNIRGQPLHLHLTKDNTSASKITLTGLDGKVWLEKETAGAYLTANSLPTASLRTGLYFLNVTDQMHSYTTKVLIK
jgi:hypothetical protein